MRTYRVDGDVVEEGDVLASGADPFGGGEVEMIARSVGIIVGHAVMPVVNEGDAVFHVAVERHDDPV